MKVHYAKASFVQSILVPECSNFQSYEREFEIPKIKFAATFQVHNSETADDADDDLRHLHGAIFKSKGIIGCFFNMWKYEPAAL